MPPITEGNAPRTATLQYSSPASLYKDYKGYLKTHGKEVDLTVLGIILYEKIAETGFEFLDEKKIKQLAIEDLMKQSNAIQANLSKLTSMEDIV